MLDLGTRTRLRDACRVLLQDRHRLFVQRHADRFASLRATAAAAARGFRTQAIDTWWGECEVRAGNSSRQKIADRLSNCTHFVILLTPNPLTAIGQEAPFTRSKDDAWNDRSQNTADAVQRRARGDENPKAIRRCHACLAWPRFHLRIRKDLTR
jgi:hypothetical protein